MDRTEAEKPVFYGNWLAEYHYESETYRCLEVDIRPWQVRCKEEF
jgi:hypothetical protein